MQRKAQSSTEYISTFAYAGLALVVVVGAMAYFGAFDNTAYVNEGCESGAQLSCADAQIATDGTISIMIENKLDRPIYVTGVTMTYAEQSHTQSVPNIIVEPRENITLEVDSGIEFADGKKEQFTYNFTFITDLTDPNPRENTVSGTATTKVEDKDEFTAEDDRPVCGDSIVQAGEQCEPSVGFTQIKCGDYDSEAYDTGWIRDCTADCKYDLVECQVTNPADTCDLDGGTWLEGKWIGDITVRCCDAGYRAIFDNQYINVYDVNGQLANINIEVDGSNYCCADEQACIYDGACYSYRENITLAVNNAALNNEVTLICDNAYSPGVIQWVAYGNQPDCSSDNYCTGILNDLSICPLQCGIKNGNFESTNIYWYHIDGLGRFVQLNGMMHLSSNTTVTHNKGVTIRYSDPIKIDPQGGPATISMDVWGLVDLVDADLVVQWTRDYSTVVATNEWSFQDQDLTMTASERSFTLDIPDAARYMTVFIRLTTPDGTGYEAHLYVDNVVVSQDSASVAGG